MVILDFPVVLHFMEMLRAMARFMQMAISMQIGILVLRAICGVAKMEAQLFLLRVKTMYNEICCNWLMSIMILFLVGGNMRINTVALLYVVVT